MLELVKRYVEVYKEQDERVMKIDALLKEIDQDNQLFSSIPHNVQKLQNDLLTKIVGGDYNFDWVQWYIFEADYGTRNNIVTIDGVDHIIDSVESLVDNLLLLRGSK